MRAEIAQGQSIGSILFELSGAATHRQPENYAPWELWGGRGSGEPLAEGEYTLTATPYPQPGLNGGALPALTVSFTVGEAEFGTSLSRVPPRVAGLPTVSAPSSGGTYAAGERIEARVSFDTPVTVDTANGTPVLGLALGGVRRQEHFLVMAERAG